MTKFNRRRTDDDAMAKWAADNGFDVAGKFHPVYSKSWLHWCGSGYVTMKIATHTYGWNIVLTNGINDLNLGNLDYVHEINDLYETLEKMSHEKRADE